MRLITLLLMSQLAVAARPNYSVKVYPDRATKGGVLLVRVASPSGLLSPPILRRGETNLNGCVCPEPKSGNYCFLIPVPLDTDEKHLSFELVTSEASPKEVFALPLLEKKFPEIKLHVNPELVKPSAEEQKRIDLEKVELEKIISSGAKKPLWDGKFQMPLRSRVTDIFGTKREFNGELKSQHYGLDLRADLKTVIHTANKGVVVLAKERFLSGNTVVVDHGLGLFSTYHHMSSLAVKVGEEVKKGQALGHAGATGRAEGPHLHWGIRIGDLLVNPLEFLRVFNSMWKPELSTAKFLTTSAKAMHKSNG